MARKYGKGAQEEVRKMVKEYKKGTARSGRSHKPVESREQAIAIGLSKARKKGVKVPVKPKTKTKTTKKTTTRRKTTQSRTKNK